MAYTLDQMNDIISLRLPDVNVPSTGKPLAASPEYVVMVLNAAQNQVVGKIDDDYFQDLLVAATGKTLTTSSYALSGLTAAPFRETMGIIAVQLSTDDKNCDILKYSEYQELVHQGYTFTTTKPACYFLAGTVYILPTSYSGTIDIFYMRTPTTMAYGDTDTSCELADEVQEIILDYATWDLLRFRPDANSQARAQKAEDSWKQRIDDINSRIDSKMTARKSLSRTAGVDYVDPTDEVR